MLGKETHKIQAEKKSDSNINIASIFLVGLIVSVVWFIIGAVVVYYYSDVQFYQHAKEWQTLITGIIALAAAWVTIQTIRHQVEEQKKENEKNADRFVNLARSKEMAMRAELPDALASLCNFSEKCVLAKVTKSTHEKDPEAPDNAINSIKRSIEFVDAQSAEQLYNLAVFYQLHNSRFFKESIADDTEERIYDAVYLRCCANRIFPYARNLEKSVPNHEFTYEEMISAFGELRFDFFPHHREIFEKVVAKIKLHFPDSEAANAPIRPANHEKS